MPRGATCSYTVLSLQNTRVYLKTPPLQLHRFVATKHACLLENAPFAATPFCRYKTRVFTWKRALCSYNISEHEAIWQWQNCSDANFGLMLPLCTPAHLRLWCHWVPFRPEIEEFYSCKNYKQSWCRCDTASFLKSSAQNVSNDVPTKCTFAATKLCSSNGQIAAASPWIVAGNSPTRPPVSLT